MLYWIVHVLMPSFIILQCTADQICWWRLDCNLLCSRGAFSDDAVWRLPDDVCRVHPRHTEKKSSVDQSTQFLPLRIGSVTPAPMLWFCPHLKQRRRKEVWDGGQNHRGSGGRKSPSGVQGRSLGRGSGAEVPQKLKNFLSSYEANFTHFL